MARAYLLLVAPVVRLPPADVFLGTGGIHTFGVELGWKKGTEMTRPCISVCIAALISIGASVGCDDSDSALNSPTSPTGAAPGTLVDAGDGQREAAMGNGNGTGNGNGNGNGGGNGGGGNPGDVDMVNLTFNAGMSGSVTADVNVNEAPTLDLFNINGGVNFGLMVGTNVDACGQGGGDDGKKRLTHAELYGLLTGGGGDLGKLTVESTGTTSTSNVIAGSLDASSTATVTYWLAAPSYRPQDLDVRPLPGSPNDPSVSETTGGAYTWSGGIVGAKELKGGKGDPTVIVCPLVGDVEFTVTPIP